MSRMEDNNNKQQTLKWNLFERLSFDTLENLLENLIKRFLIHREFKL